MDIIWSRGPTQSKISLKFIGICHQQIFMKLFKTSNIRIVQLCQELFILTFRAFSLCFAFKCSLVKFLLFFLFFVFCHLPFQWWIKICNICFVGPKKNCLWNILGQKYKHQIQQVCDWAVKPGTHWRQSWIQRRLLFVLQHVYKFFLYVFYVLKMLLFPLLFTGFLSVQIILLGILVGTLIWTVNDVFTCLRIVLSIK